MTDKQELDMFAGDNTSKGKETKYSLSDKPAHHVFDVKTVLNTAFYKDHIQEQYFIIESFDALYNCLLQIDAEINSFLATLEK